MLANLRSDSETMEMLVEAAALAAQKLEEVKKKVEQMMKSHEGQ